MLEAGPGRSPATCHELGVAPPELGVARDLVDRAGVDQRPDVRGRVQPVAEAEALGPRDEPLDQRVVDGVLDDHARAGRAALAGRTERGPQDPVGGQVEVGVGEDDDAVLAAELERHALQSSCRALRDRPTGGRMAGERDDRHVR